MTDQTNTPELRFPEFKKEWQCNTLDNCCYKISDGIHSTPIYSKSGDFSFINGNNLINGKIHFENAKLVDSKEALKHKRNLTYNETILLSINGTIGNIALYRGEKIILGKSAAYINIKANFLNPLFLYYFLETNSLQRYFRSELTGTTIKNLSIKSIKKTKLYIPNITEQRKIGDFFSKLDRQIELEEEKLELLEQQKRDYMQKIFSQELRFKDDNGNDYPDWEETTLKNITNYISSKKSSNQYNESNNSEGYPVYDAIQEIGKDLQYDMKEPYISILKDGAGVGRLNLRAGKSSVIGTMGYIQANNVDIQFLYYRMKLLNFRKFIIGSTIPHLYYKDYSKEKILIPTSNDEQKKIGHFILNIDKLISNKTLKLDYLKQRKQGLLQKMFI